MSESFRSSPLRPLIAIALAAVAVFAVLALDVPSRIAALGSGNLTRLTAPVTTVAFGRPVELAGRAERPPLEVTAQRAVPARSRMRGVHPARGNTFVAVDLQLTNRGTTPLVAGSGLLLRVVDQRGAAYANDLRVRRVRRSHVLSLAEPLKPKHTARGVVVFEVPRAARVTAIRFTVGMGLTRTAEWVAANQVK